MFDVKVVVVGAGTMGSGIAYVSAASGHELLLWSRTRSFSTLE